MSQMWLWQGGAMAMLPDTAYKGLTVRYNKRSTVCRGTYPCPLI